MSKERPILFNGEMVRAILAGRKVQTRRAVKPQPKNDPAKHHPIEPYKTSLGEWNWVLSGTGMGTGDPFPCPFGQPGDRLWVREATEADHDTSDAVTLARYSADRTPVCYPDGTGDGFDGAIQHWEHWKDKRQGAHMPRSMCRLLLDITAVRLERLQGISEADALAEGIEEIGGRFTFNGGMHESLTPRLSFQTLWDSTGGDWASNPWVWVIEFKAVTP